MRLYYNPRCSKSRAARELLEATGHPFEIVNYLDTPMDAAELGALIDRLDVAPRELVRERDDGTPGERDGVITLLVATPERIQRPILDDGISALIARPPERVFELVDPPQDSNV